MLAEIIALADEARELRISISSQIGQSYFDSKDQSVDSLVSQIQAFNGKEGDKITVLINSPGGNYFAGVHLYNELREESKAGVHITTKNVALAASAASVIFMAGDTRIVCAGSSTMVHYPLADRVMMNAESMKKVISQLDDLGSSMKATYLARASLDENTLTELMVNETMMSPNQALEHGFATEIATDSNIQACAVNVDLRAEQDKEILALIPPAPVTEVYATASQMIDICASAGMTDLITDIHKQKMTTDEVKALVKTHSDVRNVCEASNVNYDDIKANINNAPELLRSAIAACTATDDHIQIQAQMLNHTEIKPVTGI